MTFLAVSVASFPAVFNDVTERVVDDASVGVDVDAVHASLGSSGVARFGTLQSVRRA